MAASMATGNEYPSGTPPPDLRGFPDDSLGTLIIDVTPEGTTFGDLLEDADLGYSQVGKIHGKQ